MFLTLYTETSGYPLPGRLAITHYLQFHKKLLELPNPLAQYFFSQTIPTILRVTLSESGHETSSSSTHIKILFSKLLFHHTLSPQHFYNRSSTPIIMDLNVTVHIGGPPVKLINPNKIVNSR